MSSVTAPPQRWRALGELLEARRIALDPRHRSRSAFSRAVGLNDRFVADLEKGRRTTFRTTSLQAAEHAYRLNPGSLTRFATGEADELELPPHAPEEPTPPSDDTTPADYTAPRGHMEGGVDLQPGEALDWEPGSRPGEIRYTLTRQDPWARIGGSYKEGDSVSWVTRTLRDVLEQINSK